MWEIEYIMAKDKIAYVCSNCGHESTKWIGKCPNCGLWNTFKEFKISGNATYSLNKPTTNGNLSDSTPLKRKDIPFQDDPRMDMNDAEFNRVLGGGLVPGSIVLLGGEPGIGKSTLTLQTILNIPDRKILYVSGEESAKQLKMRAHRLAGAARTSDNENNDNVVILCETSLDKIFVHINNVAPDLVIVDSIQTIMSENIDSSPGSITQVRECAAALLRFAKSSGVPVILIGHINKEGTLAGPNFGTYC